MKFNLALLVLLPFVSAHFTLDFPLTRGFDEDLEPQFCGGFNTTEARQIFPLNSGPILIDSHHDMAVVGIEISFSANPINFSQFNFTDSGAKIPLLMPFGTIKGQGEWCFPVDVASLGVPGVGNGTLATIQVIFNGGDGVLLQCADVILSSTYTGSNVSCVNQTIAAVTNTSSASATTTAAGSSPSATGTKSAAAAVSVQFAREGALAALVMLGLASLL